jgi:hypothetical protein
VSQYPEYITYAFQQLGYEDYKESIQSFIAHWGGMNLETLVRVLKEGHGEDLILAILALGHIKSSWTREHILPFLQSTEPMERCASALCLGNTQEEQAFSVLCQMLTEFLPPQEHPTSEADNLWLYNSFRIEAIQILTVWAKPESVPILLHALQTFWDLEQRIPERATVARRYWRICQGRVVYALGWLRRFDDLHVKDATTQTLDAWKVYFALGYLHAHQDFPEVFTRGWAVLPQFRAFREQVCYVLQDQLGLSTEEQKRCLDAYAVTKW